MNRNAIAFAGSAALAALVAASGATAHTRLMPYDSVVTRVAGMVHDRQAVQLASKHGLQVLNVTWEDTGRWKGSAFGPNISDVTIEVMNRASGHKALMPVIRFPNFTDKTADVRLDKFFLRVGNEKKDGRDQVISLRELLANPLKYLTHPRDGRIKGGTLLAERDTHALVSAQAAFLPVPRDGKATFYPVIFNYQSTRKNPAVLTILVTRQGTSMTIVDNARDTVTGGGSWGQRLFFNKSGERAPLTAERLSDVQSKGVTSNGESAASLGEDANLLMLIQVPLKHRAPRRFKMMNAAPATAGAPMAEGVAQKSRRVGGEPDMETAVLGHGAVEGPYTELDNLTIERDPRFPVRVTVQFYQATTQPEIGEANMRKLARQIGDVYEKGDYIGSLVVPSPSDTLRPTNWDGIGTPPKGVSILPYLPGLVERYRKYRLLFPPLPGIE